MLETNAIQIGPDQISEDALNGIIENFILREGTDYGWEEILHETKMKQIRQQINRGEIKIIFDPESESATLMTSREWKTKYGKA